MDLQYVNIIFIFMFGLIIGSFLNCVIWRLHTGQSLLGRSECPKCRHKIAWYDNIPVLSYVLLRGKCRHCHTKISWQYPVVELITAVLFTVVFFAALKSSVDQNHLALLLFRNFFAISIMIIIFIYDLRWYLILDRVTLPAAFIIFIINLYLGFSLFNLLLSGIIGGSFFLVQFVISRGKWIGGGDIRLGLLMGIILGWPLIIVAIFIAYIIGSIVGVGLILFGKKKWGSEVPLGVFLTTATIIAIFWGEKILNWYLNFINI